VKRLLGALLWLAACALATSAAAHSGSLSYSFWRATPDGVAVRVQFTAADLSLLGFELDSRSSLLPEDGQRLQRLVTMRTGGTACTPVGAPERVSSTAPWMSWQWELRCASSGERVVSAALDTLFAAGQRHLLRWDDGSGRAIDHMLEVGKSTCSLGNGRAGGSSFFDYLLLGIVHLLTGWDHMLFVLALLLLADRLRDVALLVTSFTVAHSATLALSALHVVTPDPRPVEALIGFSIALLGAENAWLLAGRGQRIPAAVVAGLAALLVLGGGAVGRSAASGLLVFSACHFALLSRAKTPAPLRVAIAFAFGLIHGFGFSGVMAELDLPVARLVPALLGFNLGVELGQLGVVLICWPALRALRRARDARWYAFTVEAVSAGVCGAGVFWFAVRLFD
jgi:hypothetical protein